MDTCYILHKNVRGLKHEVCSLIDKAGYILHKNVRGLKQQIKI